MERSFPDSYQEHAGALFRFAWRLTGSVEESQDIVQECFLSLLRAESTFDATRGSLRVYLFGAVRKLVWKRLSRRREFTQEPADPVDLRSPEGELLRNEMGLAVGRAVSRLPESQREILLLAHYEQMPLAEIAAVLDLPPAAVKSRLQRARASLREWLAEYAPPVAQEKNR